MPNPKRQHSKQRGRKRRTHYKLRIAGYGPCPHCQKSIAPHRVCPFCGHYKGKPIVEVRSKDKKEKKEKVQAAAAS